MTNRCSQCLHASRRCEPSTCPEMVCSRGAGLDAHRSTGETQGGSRLRYTGARRGAVCANKGPLSRAGPRSWDPSIRSFGACPRAPLSASGVVSQPGPTEGNQSQAVASTGGGTRRQETRRPRRASSLHEGSDKHRIPAFEPPRLDGDKPRVVADSGHHQQCDAPARWRTCHPFGKEHRPPPWCADWAVDLIRASGGSSSDS
jgi:hypothetical protein